MEKSIPTVLELLRRTYGTVLIPAVLAGKEIGLAEKTTRNMLCEGRFPLSTRKVSSKCVVSIFTLAAYLEGAPDNAMQSEPAKRRRGRPAKTPRSRGEQWGSR